MTLLSRLRTARAFVIVAVVALVTAGLLACIAWHGRDASASSHVAVTQLKPEQAHTAAAVPIMSLTSPPRSALAGPAAPVPKPIVVAVAPPVPPSSIGF